jgi:hypothetical protein
MTRKMYDSAYHLDAMPRGAMYAAYRNGFATKANYAQLQALMPGAQILSITVDGSFSIVALACDICDCENGDYNPAQAALWAYYKVKAGNRPTIYVNRGNYGLVENELFKLGLRFGCDVDCWLSTLDGTITSDLPGVVAIQYNDNGLYDTSIVISPTWHLLTEAVPAPPKTEKLLEDVDVRCFKVNMSSVPGEVHYGLWQVSASGYRIPIMTEADGSAITSAWGQDTLLEISLHQLMQYPAFPQSAGINGGYSAQTP